MCAERATALITRRNAIGLGLGAAVSTFALRSPLLLAQSAPTDTPTSEAARMRWWEDARFGLFLHWGLYSVAAGEWKGQPTRGAEHFMMYERIPLKEYAQLAQGLTLKDYDPDAWVALAKQAGMKYIVITAKHHEGFAMYDSPSSAYNIVKCSPYGKDPMKPLAAACHKYGVKLCFYYSLGRDWQDPDVPTNWPTKGGRSNTWDYPDEDGKVFSRYFNRKVKPQVRELLTQYGPVGVMWFDTPELISLDESIELKTMIRQLQPNCIVDDRIGNKQGDFSTAEQHLNNTAPAGPWEACMTMSKNWGYNKNDTAYKTPEVLVRDLIEVVSAGGNLLLDTGPTAEGTFTPSAIATLQAIGKWMAINGEGIYGTTPWMVSAEAPAAGTAIAQKPPPANAAAPPAAGAMKDAVNDATSTALVPDVRFTAKGDAVYLFARSWSSPQVTVTAFAQKNLVVREVILLGSKAPVKWKQDKEKLVIDLPHGPKSDIPVYTFRVRTKSA